MYLLYFLNVLVFLEKVAVSSELSHDARCTERRSSYRGRPSLREDNPDTSKLAIRQRTLPAASTAVATSAPSDQQFEMLAAATSDLQAAEFDLPAAATSSASNPWGPDVPSSPPDAASIFTTLDSAAIESVTTVFSTSTSYQTIAESHPTAFANQATKPGIEVVTFSTSSLVVVVEAIPAIASNANAKPGLLSESPAAQTASTEPASSSDNGLTAETKLGLGLGLGIGVLLLATVAALAWILGHRRAERRYCFYGSGTYEAPGASEHVGGEARDSHMSYEKDGSETHEKDNGPIGTAGRRYELPLPEADARDKRKLGS